jgi:hypothetical protein
LFARINILNLVGILLIIMFVSLSISFSQDSSSGCTTLSIDVSARYRFEGFDGYNAGNYGNPAGIGSLNDKVTYQRIITGLSLERLNSYKFAFYIQDSRAYGWSLRDSKEPDLFKVRKPGTTAPYYTMNPNEQFWEIGDFYLELQNVLNNLTVKVGRQKIFYGDNRIFGTDDWSNTGRWIWDAAKFSYKKGENFIDFFAGGTKINHPNKTNFPFLNTEFWGGGIYARYKFMDYSILEPYYAYKSQGSADYIKDMDINQHWIGVRITQPDSTYLLYEGSATKQFGSYEGSKVSAFGLHFKVGLNLHDYWSKPIISISETYGSGGKAMDSTIRTFEPAYGASDRYYGLMNFFTWSNVLNREISLELFPVNKLNIKLAYHRFYNPALSDNPVMGNIILQKREEQIGSEFDILAQYRLNNNWQFTGAFGYFAPINLYTPDNKKLKPATWFALQVLFNF